MKNKLLKYGVFILLFTSVITGCDEYVRTEVGKDIYVNMLSLSSFVGDKIQLIASPTDGTYQYKWTSEDDAIATVDGNGLVNIVGEGNTNIIVSSGDISRIVPVIAVIKVPLTDISLSDTFIELSPGARKAILVTNIPENANDLPSYSWTSENPDIVTVNEIGELTFVGEGVTNIIYRVGNIEKKAIVDAATTRAFKGPHILSATAPREILASNFDLGGEGNAFHDLDGSNTGDNYRNNNGDPNAYAVDIEGNGTNLGYTGNGEWLLYTVEVQDAGVYVVEVSLSANGNDGKYHIEVDNVNETGSVNVPNNNSWGSWRWNPTPPLEINFTQGRHKVKFFIEAATFNFRALRFTKK